MKCLVVPGGVRIVGGSCVSIKAGTYNGFMDPIGTHGLDPLLTPSSRADEGVGVLVVWVDVWVIFGVRVLDEDSGSPTDSARITGHICGGRPYYAVSLLGRKVLDFRHKPFGGVNFLDRNDLGASGCDHVKVVFDRSSEVMADDMEGTGLRLNALEMENVNRVNMFPPEGVKVHPNVDNFAAN